MLSSPLCFDYIPFRRGKVNGYFEKISIREVIGEWANALKIFLFPPATGGGKQI